MFTPIIDLKTRAEQFAFRSQNPTTLQLIKRVDQLYHTENNRIKTAAIFLDVVKTFDRVWHEGLLHKILQIGTPILLIKIIKSFIGNRSFTIRTDNHLSSSIPQGPFLTIVPYLY